MKLFLVTVLLISMVAGTWAIDCYTCAGTGCGDPFDPSATGVSDTCPNVGITYTHCLKTVAGSTVARTCGIACVEVSGLYCCTTNLCNGGTTVTTSFVAMGVAMLAAFILARQ
ncbi:uncharacterized protein LOC105439427 [Strongylocentrotus purpuratus]|uniref:Uncharacterized protein n=1 Tax=Strongylocentrotus purpuratus TaxID=7668 RepID=A0A7M7P2J6_STRPU|nr:uncharacterized protein LOC105439427 [Strongylocentrotus purpuratus]